MIEQQLEERLRIGPISIGELVVRRDEPARYRMRHWKDDNQQRKVTVETTAIAAIQIARYDEDGNYRPLKGAPNLKTGWELSLDTVAEVRQAIDYFYPGAFATWLAFDRHEVAPIDLRETLTRQSGMYRVTQKLTGFQAEELAGRFCESRFGCLRTILWTIDGKVPQKYLPSSKFDSKADQIVERRESLEREGEAGAGAVGTPRLSSPKCYRVPYFCVEACNLFVAEARKIVKIHSA